jgi:uncharacterized membrane protein YdjX (TVP38/TMEM64 family)
MKPVTLRAALLRAALLLAAGVGLVAVILTVDLPDVSVLRAWIVSLGPFAPVVFMAVYALVVPAPFPKSVLTTMAGVAFGVARGIPLVVGGATAGAVLAFLLARTLGRDAVSRLARGHLDRIDAVITHRGILAALVVRFIPILPFTLLNYACGVTAMRLRHFALGTAVGSIPGTSAMIVISSTGAQISLWVPTIISITLGLTSLAGGLTWRHRS